MKNKTWLQRRAESKIGKPTFETQRLLLHLTEAFAARMQQRQMRRANLAREMNVDRAMVTRILNGDQNVTIKTLVTMACALDARLHFDLQDLAAVRATAIETVVNRLNLAYNAGIIQFPSGAVRGELTPRFPIKDEVSATYIIGESAAVQMNLEVGCDTTAA